jgi:nucleotide-binding universal stress UspA family protein
MKILAATDFSTRSNRALRQAGLLAQSGGTSLHIVHVVDDDQPKELVHIEKREAERLLGEQVESAPELHGTQAHTIVVAGDPFDGILRTAKEIQPDLLVLGSHRKQLLRDIFIGTTVERVIRKGSYPVLVVNHEAQRRYERVVAPVDMSDASANALRAALSIGLIDDKGATLLHAFDAPDKGKMAVGDSNRASIDSYVAGERQRAMDEIATFLVAKNLKHIPWSFHLEDDTPMEAISRAVSQMRPDLLVMGTHGHSSLVKVLMGSVTEEALHSLNVDILAVPPVKARS